MATKKLPPLVKVTAPLERVVDALLPKHTWFRSDRAARQFVRGLIRPVVIEPMMLEIVLPFTGRRVRCQVWVLTRRAGGRS